MTAKTKYNPTRSFRASDSSWEAGKRRADGEGKTMSNVMVTLLEGYARGMIDLPRVQLVYRPTAGQKE